VSKPGILAAEQDNLMPATGPRKTQKNSDFFVSDKFLYFSFVFHQKLYIYTII